MNVAELLRDKVSDAEGLGRKIWRMLWRTYERYAESRSPLLAAAIAFYSLVCLAPLGMLLAALLKLFFGHGSATERWLHSLLEGVGPDITADLMGKLDRLLANTPDASLTGVITAGALAWAGLRLFETMQISLTEIWSGHRRRGLISRKLISLAMMGLAGLLLIGYVFAHTALASLRTWLVRQGMDVTLPELIPDATPIVGFVVALVAFTLLYIFMPAQKVRFRVGFVGALFASITWHAISPLFSYIISTTQQHSAIYQDLTNVVAFSMWAFIGAQILIIGGHFAAAYEGVFLGTEDSADEQTARPV